MATDFSLSANNGPRGLWQLVGKFPRMFFGFLAGTMAIAFAEVLRTESLLLSLISTVVEHFGLENKTWIILLLLLAALLFFVLTFSFWYLVHLGSEAAHEAAEDSQAEIVGNYKIELDGLVEDYGAIVKAHQTQLNECRNWLSKLTAEIALRGEGIFLNGADFRGKEAVAAEMGVHTVHVLTADLQNDSASEFQEIVARNMSKGVGYRFYIKSNTSGRDRITRKFWKKLTEIAGDESRRLFNLKYYPFEGLLFPNDYVVLEDDENLTEDNNAVNEEDGETRAVVITGFQELRTRHETLDNAWIELSQDATAEVWERMKSIKVNSEELNRTVKGTKIIGLDSN